MTLLDMRRLATVSLRGWSGGAGVSSAAQERDVGECVHRVEDDQLGDACGRTIGVISWGAGEVEGEGDGPEVPDPRMRAACESFPPAAGGDMAAGTEGEGRGGGR